MYARLKIVSINGIWWKLNFSLLEWKFTDKHGQEAKMVPGVMNSNWRHQNESMLSLL